MTTTMTLPNQLDFVSVGPQRTGTSWLHKHLQGHAELAFPLHVKETKFFDQRFEKGLDWYWEHFGERRGDVKCGEIAPTYFHSSEAVARLRQFRDLRIMIHLRDPVARTWSLFRHHRNKGRVPNDYFEACRRMPVIEESGRYAEYCQRWETEFGVRNCLYIFQDELERRPQEVMDRVCKFVGVAGIELPDEAKARYGQNQQPKSMFVAKCSAALALHLRTSGFHRIVEAAKKLGLKQFLLGPPTEPDEMPASVREHLLEYHHRDIEFIKSKLDELGSDLSRLQSSCIA